MRSLGHRFRPLARPPVSDRQLEMYAGTWVLVRGGKVVLQASSHDALMSALGSKRVKDTDAVFHLPARGTTRAPWGSANVRRDRSTSTRGVGGRRKMTHSPQFALVPPSDGTLRDMPVIARQL